MTIQIQFAGGTDDYIVILHFLGIKYSADLFIPDCVYIYPDIEKSISLIRNSSDGVRVQIKNFLIFQELRNIIKYGLME